MVESKVFLDGLAGAIETVFSYHTYVTGVINTWDEKIRRLFVYSGNNCYQVLEVMLRRSDRRGHEIFIGRGSSNGAVDFNLFDFVNGYVCGFFREAIEKDNVRLHIASSLLRSTV